jgi:hypothetical protein
MHAQPTVPWSAQRSILREQPSAPTERSRCWLDDSCLGLRRRIGNPGHAEFRSGNQVDTENIGGE